MSQQKNYFVYIMTNKSGTLYIGVTNDIKRRVYQHKNKLIDGFTKKYNIQNLVYIETFDDPSSAIKREKSLKGLLRKKKIALINNMNPDWNDLSKDWY